MEWSVCDATNAEAFVQAIEIVALVSTGGLVVALVVQAVFHERALARLVRLAAEEPIEPISRPDIPTLPLGTPQAPKRRISVPLPGIPWRQPSPTAHPIKPSPREERHEPAGKD